MKEVTRDALICGGALAFIVLVFMSLSGCATVNYQYRGAKCETLGYSENNRSVLLKCPSPFQDWKMRDRK